jgi:hypothetical protein
MAKDYWIYWFAINHGDEIYKSVKDIILFDEEKSIERILTEPTIFLANHTSTLNIPHMHYAIQSVLAKHPQSINRMIRTISKDDNYRYERFIGPLHNNIFNMFAQKAGAILVKPKDSTNPVPRGDPLRPMITTLSAGSHVMVYPMGSVSEDGRIDFKRSDDLSTFDYRHLALIAKRVPNTHVQTMHYTLDPVHNESDPVHNDILIRMGQRHLVKDLEGYDFKKEIAKCTTITGLQLFSLYTKIAKDLGMTHTTHSLGSELSAFAEVLQARGYHVHAKDKMDRVISFADSGSPYIMNLNYQDVNIAEPTFQSNQIKHLSLDESVKRFLESRQRQV